MTSHLLRPSWLRGIVWAGATLLTVMLVHMLLVEAFLGGFEPGASAGERGEWSAIGLTVAATMGDGGSASTIGFGGVWMTAAPLVAFMLGSRVWRALHRRTTRPHAAA